MGDSRNEVQTANQQLIDRDTSFSGNLYQVWRILDQLEGHHTFYRRETILLDYGRETLTCICQPHA